MANLKKGFGLLVAIFAVVVFSTLAVYIVSNKATTSKLTLDKYYYLQSSLHMEFAKEYIHSFTYDDIDFLQMTINDTSFEIIIDINSEPTKHTAHIFVSPKEYTNVRLYDKVVVVK
ncbi:hypothetical protein [Arcobacter sp. FWKO B]|uniref:hypothetical protein n=1 Tax=Arcobacter sp. FWKO B TaxID=2593672 RepID=UPI0018A62D97|nr:hypothetical protein [Arcobacter sp. FWKO B]QOG12890.1 hypothetical protein FWKOB_09380 [Arcobacter sp. FWKO B]